MSRIVLIMIGLVTVTLGGCASELLVAQPDASGYEVTALVAN
ncbi:hypothetical protein [Reyranella sp.]